MYNHAFLILAHDSPELLQRIVDRLESPNHYVFIHLDKKSRDKFVSIQNGGYTAKRINVTHGGFNMVLAELQLLYEAFYSNVKFDFFHLLSGHDYPCVSNKVFDEFFENEPQGRSYMHFETDEQWVDKIAQRINRWHFTDFQGSKYIKKPIELFLDCLVTRSFPAELYGGGQWFSWHRSLVRWILDYYEKNPKFFSRFKYTTCCDEVIFHTLLHQYVEELNIEKNNSLRYIDWHPKRPAKTLPLVLDERDYFPIVNSGKFFCRKVFLKESSTLLDMLDDRCD